MLKIVTKIDPIEIDGEDVTGLPNEEDQLEVHAHWNSNAAIVLTYHGKSITVWADKLKRAIQNATNY